MELSSNWEGAQDYSRPKFGYSGDQIKHLMAVSIMVKTLGGLIFIYGSLFGAFLLVPTLSLLSYYIYLTARFI